MVRGLHIYQATKDVNMKTVILMLALMLAPNAKASSPEQFDIAAKNIETLVLRHTEYTRDQLTREGLDSSAQCNILKGVRHLWIVIDAEKFEQLKKDCQTVESL